jgi:hypothetical protein
MLLNETMQEVRLNKIINLVVFDYILFVSSRSSHNCRRPSICIMAVNTEVREI